MPELPEVETIRLGLIPHIQNQMVKQVVVYNRTLRWRVPTTLDKYLPMQCLQKIERRGKYLLFHTDAGCMIIHLGMSGSLHINNLLEQPLKHDHVDIIFNNKKVLRFRDPRRFGTVLWTKKNPYQYRLIKNLGVEPLSAEFDATFLYDKSRKRKRAIKIFIMDSGIVVGLGNIYANEVLFIAGIHPQRKVGNISRKRYEKLVVAIKKTLLSAIQKGGTTLRDFTNSEGRPGYFSLQLKVYGKEGKHCEQCNTIIKKIRIGQRSTFYCPYCQI